MVEVWFADIEALNQADPLEPETQRYGWDVFAGLSVEINLELAKAITSPTPDSGSRAAAEATLAERDWSWR